VTYKVFIPTAGTGSRLQGYTRYLNKSLVSVGNKPAISHLLNKFSEDSEFVIALGHKGELVRDYLTIAHPNLKFTFVEVPIFEGPKSGLGLTLLSSVNHLQEPFIFCSCDTFIESNSVPHLECDWMGYSQSQLISDYRTLKIANGMVKGIIDKGFGKLGENMPYIGLAGIYSYKKFWEAMNSGDKNILSQGESYGLSKILEIKDIKAIEFKWDDIGNQNALHLTREKYSKKDDPSILEKDNESIWFVENKVIKFSDSSEFIKNRVIRSELLQPFVPKICVSRKNMYSYEKISGSVFSKINSAVMFEKLMNFCEFFWEIKSLDLKQERDFRSRCKQFYLNKTLERLELFHANFSKIDSVNIINGFEVPTLQDLFSLINWEDLAKGVPVRFHGDLHYENILFNESEDKFYFIDWRQDFNGNLEVGDIYYDFAKLLHGLIINHEIISNNQYSIIWTDNLISYDFYRKQSLVDNESYFYTWLEKKGYSPNRVRVLTALIFLNIAPLHHYPYSLFLYVLGKDMLFQEIRKSNLESNK
jgi:NDP-sugar pyrophosphorylase family protein